MAGEGIFNMAFGAQKGQRSTSKYEGIVLNTIFNMVEADNYLKFTAEVPSTIGLRSNVYQTPPSWPSIEYSINGGEWEAFSGSDTLNISNGDNVRFRGVNTTMYGCGFTITGGVMASGSVMSLIDGIGNVKTMPSPVNQIGCFQMLFKDCTGLLTAPRLTARTLSWYCYMSMFEGCTSLTSHSDIPASEIPSSAMMNMFYGCTSLEHAGDIKATVLGQNACLSMYEGCESLQSAPKVSFEQIGTAGCDYMFKGCTSLVNIQDEWGIATIGDSGCFGMFYGCTSLEESAKIMPLSIGSRGMSVMYYGCTSLVVLHDLPCVELGQGAYNAMCYGCTSLSSIPSVLPCTSLPDGIIQYGYFGVYQSMFEGCTSITYAPSLPALVPSNLCYRRMFYGCVNLDNVNSSFVTWNPDGRCTEDWLYGVAVSGTFTGCGSLQEEYGASRIPQGWSFISEGESPLFFRSPSQNKITISGYLNNYSVLPELQYSRNGYEWYDWDYSNESITVGAMGYIFIKCKSHNDFLTESFSAIMWFEADGDVYAGGNVVSLLDSDFSYTVSHDYAFMRLFSFMGQYLKTCPDLPHNVGAAAKGVFRDMFSGCTGITSCKVVFNKQGSYDDDTCLRMFYGCTSLASAIVGNIQAECSSMFQNCSSLAMISVGFDSWYAGAGGIKTAGWVRNVAATGTFQCPSGLQQYFGDNYIPTGWNVVTPVGDSCLWFEMPNGGSITLTKSGTPVQVTLEVSLDDGNTWSEWVESNNVRSHLIAAGERLHIRNASATQTGFSTGSGNTYIFSASGELWAGGDIRSLLCKKSEDVSVLGDNCFLNLFYSCETLKSTPLLKGSVIGASSLMRTFRFCTGLVLVRSFDYTSQTGFAACRGMFQGCVLLETFPEIKVNTVSQRGLSEMFNGCTKLKEIRTQMTDISATNALDVWVNGVAPTGDFYCPQSLVIPSGSSGIPSGWTRHDI